MIFFQKRWDNFLYNESIPAGHQQLLHLLLHRMLPVSLIYYILQGKTSLENDKERLKTSLNKTLLQNQQLASELEVANSRTTELKNHVNKLESSLEKVRNFLGQAIHDKGR